MMEWKTIVGKLHKLYSIIWDNIEGVKSVLLTLLIGLSIFLTWNLWTYTPHINVLEKDEPITTAIEGGEKTKLTSIIRPKQMIIHKDGAHHWAYANSQKYLYEALQSELLLDGKNVDFEKEPQRDWVEVIYPTPIPVEVLRDTLTFASNQNKMGLLNGDMSIEKLRILRENDSWLVQFIPADPKEGLTNSYQVPQFEMPRLPAFTNATENVFTNENRKIVEVLPYEINKNVYYLPKDEMNIERLTFLIDQIPIKEFVNALLPGDYVTKHSNETNTTFFLKQSSQIKYFEDYSSFTYINNQINQPVTGYRQNAIVQSLDFINIHAGWTYDYHLYSYYDAEKDRERNNLQKELIYRMIHNGLPVIDDTIGSTPVTSIEVELTNNLVSRYNRSLINPNNELDVKGQQVTVPSGEQVQKALQKLVANYENLKITDIALGYKTSYQSTDLALEPKWYYKGMTSTWIEVDFNPKEKTSNEGG